MKFMTIYHFLLICLIAGKPYALTIEPDSLIKDIAPMASYSAPLTSVKIKNTGTAEVVIDSITIRFLDGDSADFSRGKDCPYNDYYEYNYSGWVYGISYKSLRYVKDSLFLLQDSLGNPVSLQIAPNDSMEFALYLVVNCPMCGRMPSFPGTKKYEYLFYTDNDGHPDSMLVTIKNSTSAQMGVALYTETGDHCIKKDRFTIAGRKVEVNSVNLAGVVVGEKYRIVNLDSKLMANIKRKK